MHFSGFAPALMLVAVTSTALALWLLAGRWLERLRRRTRARRAAQGETAARQLLVDLGYRIKDSQVPHGWNLQVDGRPVPVQLRADYLVSKGGRQYVAEVKTGNSAPRVDNPATRRQLLEYGLAYEVDSVLLVDMEAGKVQEVRFPRSHRSRTGGLRWGAIGVAAGSLATLALQRVGGLRELLAWVP